MFVKALLSNASCIFAYLMVVAQQGICVLQYYVWMENTMHIVSNLYAVVIICNIIVSDTFILRVKAVSICIT